ncbi:hypothetical protein SO802_002564 [Lithocarpus litseifolius]|uniref:GRF-type domain-containing protein n=1 Tax=Lithocarpus litseifolius TaxID=425828 RepID=A0AAW2DXK9_9ROSI
MSSATTYKSTSSGHMCDMDRCVERTSLSIRNFGRRFYGCQQWLLGSDQACKFFKWLDKNTCPRGRATAPLVHERFMRYKAEAIVARNERDEAHARKAEARELLMIAKCKVEKAKLALRIAEDKVYNVGDTVPYRPVRPMYTVPASAPVQVHPCFIPEKLPVVPAAYRRKSAISAQSGCFGQ